MPKVAVSIQPYPSTIMCVFMDAANTHRKVGPTRRFADDRLIFEMLRAAHANLETHNLVENALREGTVCWVTLDLTDEQYAKLKSPHAAAAPHQSRERS